MDNFSNAQIVRKPAVVSEGGIVASQHKRAAEIGAKVLAGGGDAVDAAVATSFAAGVLEPWMSGPAGGGAMVIWRAREQKAHVVHFGMRSPKSLNPADYPLSGSGQASDLFPWPNVVDDCNVSGATSIAVPGTVAGMGLAHEKFGKLDWHDLVMPAVHEAASGLHVDWYAALIIASCARALAADPTSAKVWLEDGQWPTIAGWTALSDKRIALDKMEATLRRIAQKGAEDFYRGDIAREMARDVREAGGSLGEEDLTAYRAELFEPLEIAAAGGRIFATPTMTAGPNLAHCVELLAGKMGGETTPGEQAYPAYAHALREAYRHRLTTMGDVNDDKAPGCTTHFSVVDREGNMCSVTQTLLSIFGSKFTSPSTGLLMNNGIMWFDPEPGKPNSLGPDKRCLMNICPVIGERGDMRFAIGASGGRKILPAVLQLGSFMLDHGMSLEEAFHQPRIDASGGAHVIADQALPDGVIKALETVGTTKTTRRTVFPYAFACPAGVARRGTQNEGCTEIMSPWGDAVSETQVGG